MPNTVTGFYQTLVAAATEASQALVGSNALMDSVYHDYRPEVADIGYTLNINVPPQVTSQVADAGTGDIVLQDVAPNTVPVKFDKHPYYAFNIRDFEQYNTPSSLRNVFLDPAIKGVAENIDGVIASQLPQFTVNQPISTTGSLISTSQFLAAYATLANQKVNVTDKQNMSLVAQPTVYTKILGDANWTQAQIAGQRLAENAHIDGSIDTSYGCKIKLDQAMNTLNSGTSPNQTFMSTYFHRFAIALVTRPLPEPDSSVVECTYINYKGIPIRIMLGYNQFPKMSWIVTVDAGYGVKVVRPEMGVLFSTAQ